MAVLGGLTNIIFVLLLSHQIDLHRWRFRDLGQDSIDLIQASSFAIKISEEFACFEHLSCKTKLLLVRQPCKN